METIQNQIKTALGAWNKAKSEIRKRAANLYDEICTVLKENPEFAGKVSDVLPKIYELVLAEKYIEAVCYLSILAMSLIYEKKRNSKPS